MPFIEQNSASSFRCGVFHDPLQLQIRFYAKESFFRGRQVKFASRQGILNALGRGMWRQGRNKVLMGGGLYVTFMWRTPIRKIYLWEQSFCLRLCRGLPDLYCYARINLVLNVYFCSKCCFEYGCLVIKRLKFILTWYCYV